MKPPFGWHARVKGNAALPPIPDLLKLLDSHKLVVVRGLTPLTRDAFLGYCRVADSKRDPCLHWEFGPVMELKPKENARNYLFSREAVPFHWDGAFHRVPSVLVFHCMEEPSPKAGGETLFCDTEAVLARTPPKLKGNWPKIQMSYSTDKIAHYGGKKTVPLLDRHPIKQTSILRFAEPVFTELNPVSVAINGVSRQEGERVMRYLSNRIYHPDVCYAHRWEQGDLILADNHSLIHGRRAFSAETKRHLLRIQLI